MNFSGDGERARLHGQRGRRQQEEGQVQRCPRLPSEHGPRREGP